MGKLKNFSGLKVFIDKYKFILFVAALGVLLMAFPSVSSNAKQTKSKEVIVSTKTESSTEDLLREILSKIHGAGRVEVMLTTAKGMQTIYQVNTDHSDTQTSEDTVIISDDQRAQNGLITQINPPVYQGAIVVCDGADDPTVRLSIVDAISKATGLGANQISVLKMK